MTWQETDQKDIFSRPLGENEVFIKLVGDAGLLLNREHWAINATATIEPVGSFKSTADAANLASRFRTAWAHLRFQHPSLAAGVDPDGTRLVYTVPSDRAALETWVSQTFNVAANAKTSADVIPTFTPSHYAKLVYVPRSGELLCHTSHWRTDGIGVLLLLDAFLAIASAPGPLADPVELAWGTETARLAPPIEDAANIPTHSTPELRERGGALISTFAHTVGAAGIPYLGDESTLPADTRSASLALDPNTTSAVIAACKERGITVTAAVHASVAGANYALAEGSNREKHYTSTVRVALRPYLPSPYSTPAFAAGLYTTGWMKRVEANTSWDERASAYHAEYKKGISREFLDAHREYALQLGAMIRGNAPPPPPPPPPPPDDAAAAPPPPPPPSDIDISSVGVAESLIRRSYGSTPDGNGGFEVRAVSVGVEVLSRQGTMFVWTFRDRLNLSVVYNEAFHSAEQMRRFVDVVRRELLDGLGVKEG
ncbi:hypothetical protein F4778DRAFT_711648 [Xylariomycetidae sp. FL2044]|nr:hypothetical protein F4778DRAFT_711648 [Xylariomycetidae sp. FL2044]